MSMSNAIIVLSVLAAYDIKILIFMFRILEIGLGKPLSLSCSDVLETC